MVALGVSISPSFSGCIVALKFSSTFASSGLRPTPSVFFFTTVADLSSLVGVGLLTGAGALIDVDEV